MTDFHLPENNVDEQSSPGRQPARAAQLDHISTLPPPRPNPIVTSLTMLRTPTSNVLRNAVVRAARPAPSTPVVALGCRAASTAISNPTLANIEKRWEGMPMQEQADLWMALRDRMKESWTELTVQEKKAAYWIAFGPHGPRSLPPPDEGKKVALYTFLGIGLSFVIFATMRMFAKPAPYTMTKEYQEQTNEFLKAQNSDPLTGISSEGYSGKGHVQSPSANA
ncbi:cytochrome c oxidase subunit IV-domain-containing protein [Podospora didyma]|uniref:Cytochrome c oxidase polypeptide V n=1 Tax=Podospora didyma TaxID=330526 RepID=A0AAE0NSQ0_9PEZI|nr:cytochrome c oxidase subunit IV-domain-containing protein [Podospora didyma]